MVNLEQLFAFILSKNFKTIAIGYDGSPLGFRDKNFIESNLMAHGIDIVDLDEITTSFMSNIIPKTQAEFGIYLDASEIEQNFFLISNEGKILKINSAIHVNAKLSEWNEVGQAYKFEYVPLLKRDVDKLLKNTFREKLNLNVILNLNYSPSSKVFPYILRNYFSRVTTLNAVAGYSERKIEDQKLTEIFFESYNADIGIEVDKNCENLKIITKKGYIKAEEIIKNFLRGLEILGFKVKRLGVLGNLDFKFISDFEILKINSPFELDLNQNDIVFDSNRNSFIFPRFSFWFDSMMTFLIFSIGFFKSG